MEAWGFRMAMITFLFSMLIKISNCFLKSISYGLFFLYFCFYSFIITFFILSFFYIFLKFLLLFLFFFLNIFTFVLTIDTNQFWTLFFDLFSTRYAFSNISYFFGVFLVFCLDCFSFITLNFLSIFNLKNFVGIFGYFGQFFTLYWMECIYLMDDQASVEFELEDENYIYPCFYLGDNLERAFRFRKILDLFYFSDIFHEKTFVYRRVGLLNSRFWMFRHFQAPLGMDNDAAEETFLRIEFGTFLEPDRWLLDFRDLRPADYLDPWHFFSNRHIFRNLDDFNVSPLYRTLEHNVAVQLLHNYTAVMESEFDSPAERTFPVFDNVTTTEFAEWAYFFIFSFLIFQTDAHISRINAGLPQIEDKEEDKAPDMTDGDNTKRHPIYDSWYINENLESQLFSMQPMDFREYSLDDDLSWDALLAQPDALRYADTEFENSSNIEVHVQNNYLFDEVRTFSVLYPLYKLMYKISPYKFIDFFLFTDSGRCFKIIFKGLLYLPIGVMIVFIKCIVKLFDVIYSFNIFFKCVLFFLFLVFFVIFFF